MRCYINTILFLTIVWSIAGCGLQNEFNKKRSEVKKASLTENKQVQKSEKLKEVPHSGAPSVKNREEELGSVTLETPANSRNQQVLEKLLRLSDLVVYGKVTEIKYKLQEGKPVTALSFSTSHVVKGELPEESEDSREITIAYLGGVNPNTGEILEIRNCRHLLFTGEKYVLFIKDNGISRCPFVENGVMQSYEKDGSEYLFDLDGFPVTDLLTKNSVNHRNREALGTGMKQNKRVLERTIKSFDRRKEKEFIPSADGKYLYCDCLVPGYNYDELAEIYIDQGAMSRSMSRHRKLEKVTPTEDAFGVTFDGFKSQLNWLSKNNRSFARVLNRKDSKFDNYDGKIRGELLPKAVATKLGDEVDPSSFEIPTEDQLRDLEQEQEL